MKNLLLALIITFLAMGVSAQEIRINEAVSSNSVYLDEDGDSPDWFELQNYGSIPVSIHNWGITDDVEEINMWTFPDITLQPNEYLMVWASNKDRREVTYARTLIDRGDIVKYVLPTSELPSTWTSLNFDDSEWKEGSTGIGYADGDDETVLARGTKAVFIRKFFRIVDVSDVNSLMLDMDYDDGFVAYLNGKEIARSNINGNPPAYNSGTITDHEANIYGGGTPERFVIDNAQSLLNTGDNVLSIQLHNLSAYSSDMSLIPFLSAIYSSYSSDGVKPPSVLNLSSNNLHTNFKISSKEETLTLSDNNGNIVDDIFITGLFSDVSIGVSVLDNSLVYYNKTTPAYANSTEEALGTINKSVIFSHDGGAVVNDIALSLSGNTDGEIIRYTGDATEPNESSSIYSTPININTNTVIRAKIFKENYISSLSRSKTFLFNTSHDLPVVALVTDPYNLFDNDYGMYVFGDDYNHKFPYFGANFWEDWERPVQFSLYEKEGNLGTEFNAGMKIFGGWSRGNEQRSLSIFARGQYGTSEIDYPLFPDLPYDKFQALVLRNSGNDWLRTMIRDVALTSLMEGTDLEFQAYKPTVTYINGDYWGIYNLREKVNEHFLASKHNIDPDSIDMLERNGEIIEGDNTEYLSLIDYITSNSLVSDENYNYVTDRIDVDNFILYYVAQIYFNNTDWPGNNIKYWKSPGGKWRWILYDTDHGFGIWNVEDYKHDALSFALEPNGPDWPNPPWSTLMFRKLIENETFRNKYINRFADELNTRFLAANVTQHIQDVFDVISSEVNAHYSRWGSEYNSRNVENMKVFARNRPSYSISHIKNKFSISTTHRLILFNESISEGFIMLNNNLNIQLNEWGGDYFDDIPVTLKAVAKAGFEFSHWTGDVESTDDEIELSMVSQMRVKAHFVVSSGEVKPIVINEICYKSGDVVDGKDWIELYNPNSTNLDISSWVFKDSKDSNIFIIPDGTSIAGNTYLVITKSTEDFIAAFPGVTNFIGDFEFGLSSSGDAVRIFDDSLVLQDEVYYESSAPWQACANGKGPTLELKSPDLDNSLPESWDCLSSYGSPGVANGASMGIDDDANMKIDLYPNPIVNYLYITGFTGKAKVLIRDMKGRVLLNKSFEDKLFLGELKTGIYLLTLENTGRAYNFKIIKQ
ncbi:MAG: CotH kinase family protein [Flavobacteriales bacterium]|nr:CotH kinase family protein [Flavobacteriales bacterium]